LQKLGFQANAIADAVSALAPHVRLKRLPIGLGMTLQIRPSEQEGANPILQALTLQPGGVGESRSSEMTKASTSSSCRIAPQLDKFGQQRLNDVRSRHCFNPSLGTPRYRVEIIYFVLSASISLGDVLCNCRCID
jgi:hypothetical protein